MQRSSSLYRDFLETTVLNLLKERERYGKNDLDPFDGLDCRGELVSYSPYNIKQLIIEVKSQDGCLIKGIYEVSGRGLIVTVDRAFGESISTGAKLLLGSNGDSVEVQVTTVETSSAPGTMVGLVLGGVERSQVHIGDLLQLRS